MREPPAPATITPLLEMLAVGVTAAWVAYMLIRSLRGVRAGLVLSVRAGLAASRRLVPSERLAAQARLLRRIVWRVSGDKAARAEGAAWLATLDRVFATTFFTAGEGRIFGEALYRRGPECDVEAIDSALSSLVQNVRT